MLICSSTTVHVRCFRQGHFYVLIIRNPPSRGIKMVAASPVGAVLFIKRYEWRFLLLIGLCTGIVRRCWANELVEPMKFGCFDGVS